MAQTDDKVAIDWPAPPDASEIESDEIHLWAAALGEFEGQLARLGAVLPAAEQVRAGAFKFARDRNRFIMRRGLLRVILGKYLGQEPAAIGFEQGVHGKPEVKAEAGGRAFFFNASHSGEIAVWAINHTCAIGVDVEQTVEISEMQSIARHFFLPQEARTLDSLPGDSQQAAFYACWTRKEAFLKATGEGIAESLAKAEVTLKAGDEAQVVSIAGDRNAGTEWQLRPFVPARGYLGCVAYRAAEMKVTQWRVAQSITQSLPL